MNASSSLSSLWNPPPTALQSVCMSGLGGARGLCADQASCYCRTDALPDLNSLSVDESLVNPRLEKMKNEVIVPFFRDNPDSRCILFTKTRYNFQKNVFSFVQKTVNGYFSDAEVGLNL